MSYQWENAATYTRTSIRYPVASQNNVLVKGESVDLTSAHRGCRQGKAVDRSPVHPPLGLNMHENIHMQNSTQSWTRTQLFNSNVVFKMACWMSGWAWLVTLDHDHGYIYRDSTILSTDLLLYKTVIQIRCLSCSENIPFVFPACPRVGSWYGNMAG